jgi:hypothetical protein
MAAACRHFVTLPADARADVTRRAHAAVAARDWAAVGARTLAVYREALAAVTR